MDTLTAEARPGEAGAGFRALPDEAPLEMPTQSLWTAPRSGRPASSPPGMIWRRLFVIGGAILLTAAAGWQMYEVLRVGGLTLLELLILVLFVVLFAWIALSFFSALGGFVSVLRRGGLRLGIARDGPLPPLSARAALLMPTYNEDPARVMAGLQATAESVQAAGASAQCDLFILSDTTNPDIWVAEEAAFLALRDRIGAAGPRVFYRRRARNTARKAGNIAEWVRRFGGAYPHFLILDADSVMEGGAIVRLAAAMERHPDAGLIQTLPVIVNGVSFFARMQQFAGRVYGPLIAHGIAWWHGAEGNYWGHNAIIRTRAFAEQAGLPDLPGRRPFGGHIMSHDFVEAALMRRGGWAIHMVPGLPGSYEESPPSLTDLSVRDRRWCQGNLQHAGVLPARGLHWVSRLHLLMGIGSYITAPLWLLFLAVGLLISLQARFVPPDYFPAGRSLFPQWPAQDPVRAMWMFIGTMGVLLAPKLLAFLALLFNRAERRGCGGAPAAFASLLIETLVAGLLAPVTMLTQSVDAVAILLGRDSGWNAQRRGDGSIPIGQVAARYWRHTGFGVVFGASAWLVSPALLLWMLPVVLGLALAIPLAAFTAAPGPGLAARRARLLLIPEERRPPEVLSRARALLPLLQAVPVTEAARCLLGDPALLAAHRAMLPPPRRPRQDPIDATLLVGLARLEEARSLDEALAGLDAREKAAVLADARGLDRLAALTG